MRSIKQGRLSPRDPTLLVDDDIITNTATFLNCAELRAMGYICRRFAAVSARESIWKLRCLDILPLEQVDAAISALNLSSFRQLLETFTRVGIPRGVLGFWRTDLSAESRSHPHACPGRRMPSAALTSSMPALREAETRGELLRIKLVAGGFLCESIAPEGTIRGVFMIWVVALGRQVKVGFFNMEESVSSANSEARPWVPGKTITEAFMASASAVPSAMDRTRIRPVGDDGFILPRADGRESSFTKLGDPPSMGNAFARPLSETIALDLCGLWCAPYGSHGLEIIHLSVACPETDDVQAHLDGKMDPAVSEKPGSPSGSSDRGKWASQKVPSSSASICTSPPASLDSDDSGEEEGNEDEHEDDAVHVGDDGAIGPQPEALMANNMYSELRYSSRSSRGVYAARGQSDIDDKKPTLHEYPRLFGVKVTGDPNVPTGKVSFAVDLETACDIDEELNGDTRPVVLFLATGAVMTNLAHRRNSIAMWRKGRAQMNRFPDRWCPEWVDIDFVVYHPGERCKFSVVIRRPMESVRLIMDFERALGEREVWPQWGMAPASIS